MIRIVFPSNEATNEAFAQWVMERLGRRAVKPYRTIAAVDEGDRIVAGVVLNGYNGANVDLTAYAPGAFSRKAITTILSYAFINLKATRITARIRRGRVTMVGGVNFGDVLTRMGFVREAVATHYYGEGKGNDAIVYRMLRGEWLCEYGGENGRTRATRSQRNRGRSGADEPRNSHHASRAEQL